MDTQKYKATNTMLTGRRKMAQLKRIEDIGAHERAKQLLPLLNPPKEKKQGQSASSARRG